MEVYEEQSGDKVSENIRLAVMQKYLCDGELARHWNKQSARLTTYDLPRKKAINHSARAKAARRAKARAKVTSQRNRRSASTAGSPATTRTSAETSQLP